MIQPHRDLYGHHHEKEVNGSAAQAVPSEPSPWADDFSLGYVTVARSIRRSSTAIPTDDPLSLNHRRTVQHLHQHERAGSTSSTRSAHVAPEDGRHSYSGSSTHRRAVSGGLPITRAPSEHSFQNYGVHTRVSEPMLSPPLWCSDDMLYSSTHPTSGRRPSRMPDDELYVVASHFDVHPTKSSICYPPYKLRSQVTAVQMFLSTR